MAHGAVVSLSPARERGKLSERKIRKGFLQRGFVGLMPCLCVDSSILFFQVVGKERVEIAGTYAYFLYYIYMYKVV